MAFNPLSMLKMANPDPNKAGKTLLVINALGMVFAALSNTFAAAVDKNTSEEDKKFLVPAGFVTGVANIGLYYLMTDKIIDKLKDSAGALVDKMRKDGTLQPKVDEFVKRELAKAKKPEMQESMKEFFSKSTQVGKETIKNDVLTYTNNCKAAAGVLGAFFGAVVGCAIITPIIRDVSAYFVQKRLEKSNPDMKEKPYKPYFEPTRIESVRYGNINKRQPISMKSYMQITSHKAHGMKI